MDFHLSLDVQHILATTADVSPPVEPAAGDIVEVTDGDLMCQVVVAVNRDALSLLVEQDTGSPAAVRRPGRATALAGPGDPGQVS